MKLQRCDMETFSSVCEGKKLACYGIGGEFNRIIKNYQGYGWENDICYLVDGNSVRDGEEVVVNERTYKILSLEHFLKEDMRGVILFITCTAYSEVVERLNTIEKLNDVECYLFHFMYALNEGIDYAIRRTDLKRIPPVIHYCWFGGNELSDLYKRCIESWHKMCPDYEIKEWNEGNCNIDETMFTKEAYECKKYGFVTDYFKLKIIYENGGICLDTDVEILKNFDDLRYNEAFCGMEYPGKVAFGLGFGAEKGNKIISYLMNRYKEMHFIKNGESMDDILCPVIQTKDLMSIGMKYSSKLQTVGDMTVYPVEVLCPKNVYTGETVITEKTYAIHHYDGSWVDIEKKREKNKKYVQAEDILRNFL